MSSSCSANKPRLKLTVKSQLGALYIEGRDASVFTGIFCNIG